MSVVVKSFQLALLITFAIPVLCRAEGGKEQYLETGETCAMAHEPVSVITIIDVVMFTLFDGVVGSARCV